MINLGQAVKVFIAILFVLFMYLTKDSPELFYGEDKYKTFDFSNNLKKIYISHDKGETWSVIEKNVSSVFTKVRYATNIGYAGKGFDQCKLLIKLEYNNSQQKIIKFYSRDPINNCSLLIIDSGRHYDGFELLKVIEEIGVRSPI